MNHLPNQQRYQRTEAQRQREQRGHGRRGDNAPRPTNGEPTLDQHAGAVARAIIKESGIEDTTPHWRAVKNAYLAGYEDARR